MIFYIYTLTKLKPNVIPLFEFNFQEESNPILFSRVNFRPFKSQL